MAIRNLKSIESEEELDKAFKRVDELWYKESKPGSPEWQELDDLVDLIVEYEDKHYPIK